VLTYFGGTNNGERDWDGAGAVGMTARPES
jgi:hypothetical protein